MALDLQNFIFDFWDIGKYTTMQCLMVRPRAVVCSAMGKTTNSLLSAGEMAMEGHVDVQALRPLHLGTCKHFYVFFRGGGIIRVDSITVAEAIPRPINRYREHDSSSDDLRAQ